jgi:hypothetical protein
MSHPAPQSYAEGVRAGDSVRTSISRKIVAIVAALFLAFLTTVDEATAQNPFYISATDTTIYAPDSGQIIGHGQYKISHVDGFEVVEGEDKYLDGEYDHEEQRLQPSVGDLPPVLVYYQHRYFNADGSDQYEESLEARSGNATCKFYESGVPDIRATILKVPPDTYAGATQLMLLVGRLREAAPRITFHSFNCIPEPKIIAIEAAPLSGPAAWAMYPGNLVKMEMKPDLGIFDVLVAPFIPKVYAWFDPANAFNYVGGRFDRYYKGRHVLMVRTHDANPVAQSSASAPPDVDSPR